jgi:hypothetical protein
VHLYLGNSPSYWLGAKCSGNAQERRHEGTLSMARHV